MHQNGKISAHLLDLLALGEPANHFLLLNQYTPRLKKLSPV